MAASHRVEQLYLNGDKGHPSGECMEVWEGCWLWYERAKDRIILGKLDFGQDKQTPVVDACKAAVGGATTLGWQFSGSMEALTIAPDEIDAIKPVLAWFTQHRPRYRFDLHPFR